MRQRHRPVKRKLGDGFAPTGQFLGGLGNIPASAVVETDIENQAGIARRAEFRLDKG